MAWNDFLDRGLFEKTLWGVEYSEYFYAALILVAVVVLLKIFQLMILGRLKKLAKKTKTQVDDAIIHGIEHLGAPFYFGIALYFALQRFNLSQNALRWTNYAIMVVVVFYAVRAIHKMITFGTKKVIETRDDEDNTIVRFLGTFLKGTLWLLAVLLLLSNMGYNITSLIAGLGVAGIAIGLALQNILEDLFSSISIYFDKPFKVGDFIVVGDYLGVVKRIGIKTTRLESLWGEELVISNRELTSTRVKNYKKMERRRIHYTFGVTYDTPVKKLEKINRMVRDIVDKVELADLDRVHFKEHADSSLKFEMAYYVNSKEYADYMDVQQKINLELNKRFEKEGIEFAFPTRTIYMEKPTKKRSSKR